MPGITAASTDRMMDSLNPCRYAPCVAMLTLLSVKALVSGFWKAPIATAIIGMTRPSVT